MAFDELHRKQCVLAELVKAARKIEEMLPELTAAEADTFLSDLGALVRVRAAQDRSVGAPDRGRQPTSTPSPTLTRTATPADEALLARAPETGLSVRAIVAALEGNIRSSSNKPRSVIHSAISYLKKEGRVTRLASGNYIAKGARG